MSTERAWPNRSAVYVELLLQHQDCRCQGCGAVPEEPAICLVRGNTCHAVAFAREHVSFHRIAFEKEHVSSAPGPSGSPGADAIKEIACR